MAVTDAQRAYEQVKERIITTRMPPGAVIQIDELMADLNLGRTPIREALKLLEAQRLVSVSPRRGMFVAPINLADLGEIEEMRSVLDPLSVRLAAARIMPAELAELTEIVRQAGPAGRAGDVDALLELDRRYHRLLAIATRNDLLRNEMEMLYDLSNRIWYYYVDKLDPADVAFDALEEIVDALSRRDSVAAELAMKRHIWRFGESIKRCL